MGLDRAAVHAAGRLWAGRVGLGRLFGLALDGHFRAVITDCSLFAGANRRPAESESEGRKFESCWAHHPGERTILRHILQPGVAVRKSVARPQLAQRNGESEVTKGRPGRRDGREAVSCGDVRPEAAFPEFVSGRIIVTASSPQEDRREDAPGPPTLSRGSLELIVGIFLPTGSGRSRSPGQSTPEVRVGNLLVPSPAAR